MFWHRHVIAQQTYPTEQQQQQKELSLCLCWCSIIVWSARLDRFTKLNRQINAHTLCTAMYGETFSMRTLIIQTIKETII